MGKTHNSHLKYQIAVGVGSILINFLIPDIIYEIRFWILGLVILVIGMPHGALDHIIAFKAFDRPKNFRNQFIFYAGYLSVMFLYGLFWVFFPFAAFMFFLLMTLYHFGQADAERFSFEGWPKHAMLYARGLTIVGLILFSSEPYYSSSIIEEVTGYSIAGALFPIVTPDILSNSLALIYPISYLLLTILKKPENLLSLLSLDAIIVPFLFYYCDPIFAFSVYFGCWHAFNHTKTMLNFLEKFGEEVSFIWFYKSTFLYSVISYAGLIALYFILQAFGNEELLVALLFILISVLTLPHMFVVEKIYSNFYHNKKQ